jgi:hypothetical protein
MKNKVLGISQPIPYCVLEEAVYDYLKSGNVDRDKIIHNLGEYFRGKISIQNAAITVNKIVSANAAILAKIKKDIDGDTYINLPEGERKLLVICLIALTYPVFYEIMKVLGVGFKVQQKLSKVIVEQKLTALYGSNRAVYNAISSVLQMLKKYGILSSEKVGIYSLLSPVHSQIPLLCELCVYTDIKLSESNSILLEETEVRPFYMFIDIALPKPADFRLLKFSEGIIGRGYITV